MARFRRPTEKTPTDWKGILPTPRKAYRRLPLTAPDFLREMEEDALYAAALDALPEMEAGLSDLRGALADFNCSMERRGLACRIVFRTAVTIDIDGGPAVISAALDALPNDSWEHRTLLVVLVAIMRPCDEHAFTDYAKDFWWQFGRHTKKGRLAKLEAVYRENKIVADEKAAIAASRALFVLERKVQAMIREDRNLLQNLSPPARQALVTNLTAPKPIPERGAKGRYVFLRYTGKWLYFDEKDSLEARVWARKLSEIPAFVPDFDRSGGKRSKIG